MCKILCDNKQVILGGIGGQGCTSILLKIWYKFKFW